jgi:hypothetical protein
MHGSRRSILSRVAFASALVGLTAAFLVGAGAGAGAATHQRVLRLPAHPTPRTVTLPHTLTAPSAVGAVQKLKTWTSSIAAPGGPYSYTMVGKKVTKAQAIPSVTVNAPVIPIIVTIGGHTWDPTVSSGVCGETASVLSRVQKSPLFDKTTTYTMNGVNEGATQYIDAFQRANFDKYTKATGVNPGYHVLIKYSAHPAITITNPPGGATGAGGCEIEGAMEINWFDTYLQNTVFPMLALETKPLGPKVFPIFVMRNVTFYIGTTSNCCALGYHNAFNNPAFGGNIQSYTAFEWPDNTFFPASYNDTVVGSHEVGEWMDDPFVNNATPSWGNIGQVSGCQGNLEVGDPLTPTNVPPVTVNGYTYHLQELAFFSWFYHQSPSIGAGGKYSNNGTFTTFAANCP